MRAMVVNDYAGNQMPSGAYEFSRACSLLQGAG